MESAYVEVQNIFHRRNNITCSKNCKYRTAATLYTQETWFVFRYIVRYTLHKGDNKDDDDDDDDNHNINQYYKDLDFVACSFVLEVVT